MTMLVGASQVRARAAQMERVTSSWKIGWTRGSPPFGQGHHGQEGEQRGEALDVVLALGAVDHGRVQDDAGAPGGEEGGLTGQNAVGVIVRPLGEFAGAAEEDEGGLGRSCRDDRGGVAGVGTGDDACGAGQRGAKRGRIGEVRDVRGLRPAPAGGVAHDRNEGCGVRSEAGTEGQTGASRGADDVDRGRHVAGATAGGRVVSSSVSSSRLMPLVSGSMKMVTTSPSRLTRAATPSAKCNPPWLRKMGKRNTPTKPPTLPAAAAMP